MNFDNFKFKKHHGKLMQSVHEAFNSMNNSFYKSELLEHIETNYSNGFYDASIMGALVRLKMSSAINYIVIDKYRGIYKKVK